MKYSTQDYIEYRLKRGKESLEEAQIMFKQEHWNLSINRLYYACYYSISALLLASHISPKTHSGVHSQFNLHFVKKSKVSKEDGNLFTELMNMRTKGDYGDMFEFDKKTIKPLIPRVKKFLHDIEKLINVKRKS